jgi:aryl-alcohol dehydrogenase-like predicted oxidoreductase
MRRELPRFQGENFQRNLDLVDAVRDLAAAKNVTPGQVALAWLLAHGDDIAPIPGTRRRTNLGENLAAVDVTLTEAELTQLDAVFGPDAVAGERYDADKLKLVDRDES